MTPTSLAVQHQHDSASRCTVCRSLCSMYGCTGLICRGLDCD